MSALDEIKREGLMSKKDFKALEIRAKAKAKQIKLERKRIDLLARIIFKKYIANGRSWKGLEKDRTLFRKQMTQRHKLHERIARLVDETVEPEWESLKCQSNHARA